MAARLTSSRGALVALIALPAVQVTTAFTLDGIPQTVILGSAYMVAMIYAVWVSVRAARHGDRSEVHAWRPLAVAFALMMTGSVFAGIMAGLEQFQLSHYGEYGRVLAVPFLIRGLACLPKGPHAANYWQNGLDAATSLLCFLLVAWVVFNDTVHPDGMLDGTMLVIRPVLNALLATGAVMALVSGRFGSGISLRRLVMCTIGALLIAIGDSGMALTADGNDGPVPYAFIPVTFGALCFAWAAATTNPDVESIRARLFVGSLAPIVPLVSAFVLAVYLIWRPQSADPVTVLLASSALVLVLVAVVVGRFDAFETRESLEQRVIQRTIDIGTRERWFRALVQNSSDVVTVVDPHGVVRYQTPSAERVLGHNPYEMVDKNLTELMRPADGRELLDALRAATEEPGSVRTLEFPLWHRDGRWRETETTITSLVTEPHVRGLVLNTRDVSERRRLQKELMQQAYSDALTGLANRALFRERIRAELAEAAPMTVAVRFLDLNGFKSVNDTQGHAVGDRLLTLVGQRLKNCVRPGDLVARLGGDEFGILVTGESAEEGAIWVADRVRRVLAHDFELETRQVPLGASVGIALNEHGDETADQLLSNADLAMYRAKTSERTEFVRFESAMHQDLLARVQAEADLRAAVADGDLRLNYQPIVELATGRVMGVEALSRWTHPERGVIDPEEFIELAEQTGLVEKIGGWALREACLDAARWQPFADPSRGVFRIAVNVSARQITPAFPGIVAEALEAAGLPGNALTIEVTESVLMARPEEAVEILGQVKRLGVRIAVDDFGTGYSSLSYLSRFPVDILKIDRSFVEHATSEPEKAELVRTIVHLGRALGLNTVAEGIETPEQHRFLLDLGCPLGQGFLFAQPMPQAEVLAYLRNEQEVGPTRAPQSLPTP